MLDSRLLISLCLIAPLALLLSTAPCAAKTRDVEYRHGDAQLRGYLAWEGGTAKKRPGVLIIHDFWGMSPFVKERARRIAGLGCVAFALDMYGRDVRPKTMAEASAQSSLYSGDRALMRSRARAGLEELLKIGFVDPKRIVVMGYCFGGTASLELARAGAELAGVVSFHGSLATPNPEDGKRIKAKVLALCGADDPFVPPAQRNAFEEEMRNSRVDWQLVLYSGAVHAFTRPDAGSDPSKGAAYNEEADLRSWEAMKQFFHELF